MIIPQRTTVRTLPTRIVVDLFDGGDVFDMDESVRDEVLADIDAGRAESYMVRVERQTPGGQWERIQGSGISTVDDAGHSGTYGTSDDLPTASLRENARAALADVPADALTMRTVAVAVELKLPQFLTIEVDADAWAREYGNGASEAEVGKDVREYYSPEKIMEIIRESYPMTSGLAWLPTRR